MKNEETRDKLKTSEFKDINLEKQFISGIIFIPDLIFKYAENINPEIFSSSRCKWIYQKIIEFYNAHGVRMDEKTFEICVSSLSPIQKKSYKKLWNSIMKLKSTVSYSKCIAIAERLQKLHRGRLLELGLQNTIKSLEKAVDGDESHLMSAISEYTKISDKLQQKSISIVWSDPLEKYLEFKTTFKKIQKDPEKFTGILTGIKNIDEKMKGLRPSEFGLITAGSGVGKSIFLLDIAFNCYMSQGDILYITIEMPGNQIRERFYCRLSGIKYDYFRGYELDNKHWEKLDGMMNKLQKENKNKFMILDIPRSSNPKSLRNEIENYVNRNNRIPKLIVIDYLNIMEGGFDWSRQVEIAMGIKQEIARHLKIPTWSANQLSGSKHDKEDIKIPDLAFARHIIDNVDVGIGLGLTDLEDIFNVSWLKTRDFSAKTFRIYGDRSLMSFSLKPPSKENKKEKSKEKHKKLSKVKASEIVV